MDTVRVIDGQAFVSVDFINNEIEWLHALTYRVELRILQDTINGTVVAHFDPLGA